MKLCQLRLQWHVSLDATAAYAWVERGGWALQTPGEWGRAQGYRDVLPSRSPFSGYILALETYLFKPLFSSIDPTSIFWNNLAFQDQFLQIWTKFVAPETQILARICSRDPSFRQKKNSFRDLIFENLGGTHLPNFFFRLPPRGQKTPYRAL